MNERNLRVLEFPKILEMLASLVVTDLGREAARALTDDASAFEALSERLLLWSGNAIRELSVANGNDT